MAGLPDLEKCVQCGDCGAVCPITPYHSSEAYSPRGRLFFLNMASKTQYPSGVWNQFQKLLFDCTACGRCQEICDSDVDLISLWEQSRKDALQSGKQSELQSLVETLKTSKNIFGMDNDDREDLIVSGVEDEVPDIETRVYTIGKKSDLVFFVGCLQSFRAAQIPALTAQLKLLEEYAKDYLILGGEEYCCGHPLGVLGLEEDIKPFKEHHKDLFDAIGAKTIVTNCPGCLISLRNRYDLLQETLHFSEWLIQNLPEGENLELQEEAVFHEPCELSNVLQVKTPPSDVLRKIGVKTSESEPLCCGGGGMLRITNNELSQMLAESRMGSNKENQLITSCPSCYEQFRQLGVNVKDLAEIVESKKKR
jgi:Fe-S oxidoreductase